MRNGVTKKMLRWRVKYTGNNNEILSVSENLNSRTSAIKNILAHLKIFDGTVVEVSEVNKAIKFELRGDGVERVPGV